jgi:hypothetical protein
LSIFLLNKIKITKIDIFCVILLLLLVFNSIFFAFTLIFILLTMHEPTNSNLVKIKNKLNGGKKHKTSSTSNVESVKVQYPINKSQDKGSDKVKPKKKKMSKERRKLKSVVKSSQKVDNIQDLPILNAPPSVKISDLPILNAPPSVKISDLPILNASKKVCHSHNPKQVSHSHNHVQCEHLDESDKICKRFIFTKCKGKNCKQKHITAKELWNIMSVKGLINFDNFNAISNFPYCKNSVAGRCNSKKCPPERHISGKDLVVFLSANNVIPSSFNI